MQFYTTISSGKYDALKDSLLSLCLLLSSSCVTAASTRQNDVKFAVV